MKNQKKGFTLIELLVVIAIIGLLATLSVVSLNNARERARDSRRVSDIRQIQTALELYHNAESEYPVNLTDLSDFINPVPSNPSETDCVTLDNNNDYVYNKTGDNTYTLEYCLMHATGGLSPGNNKTATEMSIE